MPFSHDEPQVKHPSLEGLIAWLETQDLSTTYDYGDITTCVLAEYHRAQGTPFRVVIISEQSVYGDLERAACCGQRSYAAALSRARALLPETADAG